MLTKYNLKMPHAVFSGEDALEKICDIFAENHVKRLAVFSDKGIEGAGLLDFPMARVKASGVAYTVLDDLPAEPSYMEAQKLVDQCKEYGADFIMAVGGGSVQDTAKLASILMTDEYGIKELLDEPGRAKKCIKTLMIPTTAGTGSEATPNAIVAVPEKQLKVGIVNTNMIADYVILDAVMIKKLPRKIAAATGVDALAHAIECWTSNKANPFSDLYALEGLDLILNNIEKACDDPEAMAEKNRMQIAAYYGGLAITASGTTAVHALSYPLGAVYHVPHGESNYAMFTGVLKNYLELRQDGEIAVMNEFLARLLGCGTQAVYDRLEELLNQLLPKRSLHEYGVTRQDLRDFTHSVITGQGRLMDNSFVPLDETRVLKIYTELF